MTETKTETMTKKETEATDSPIAAKLAALREQMKQKGADACIIPTSDPHLSEYVADHWKTRQEYSGFSGSAGTLVVGMDWAGLWTDSRYYLQAAEQLRGTGIELEKDGEDATPSISEAIGSHKRHSSVLCDMHLLSAKAWACLAGRLSQSQSTLKGGSIDWQAGTRPPIPYCRAFEHEAQYSGRTTEQNLREVRKAMAEAGADYMLTSDLAEIAWTLNLRCDGDIRYTPVKYAYLVIWNKSATLLCGKSALGDIDQAVADKLARDGVSVYDYELSDKCIEALATASGLKGQSWLIDKSNTNAYLASLIGKSNTIIDRESPIARLKAVKNSTQLSGTRRAQIADGIAMTKAFCWLDSQIANNEEVSETGFAAHLDECRSKDARFWGLSFNTIAGYGSNGAIVHYSATPQTDKKLERGGFLLVDSGGNYLDGTTDITRTVWLGPGPAPSLEKECYTLVLKGHIALARAQFVKGTSGQQLDSLARTPLWQHGLNYGHGTGHGIGHFLGVHEGPERISTRLSSTPLEPGMQISNEPGVYLEGRFGIRLENMVAVVEAQKTEFGNFYAFETLSHFPFCSKAIDPGMLTPDERDWLNSYHQETYRLLSEAGGLTTEELEWLRKQTEEI